MKTTAFDRMPDAPAFDEARAADELPAVDACARRLDRTADLRYFSRMSGALREWVFFRQIAEGARPAYSAADLFPWEV